MPRCGGVLGGGRWGVIPLFRFCVLGVPLAHTSFSLAVVWRWWCARCVHAGWRLGRVQPLASFRYVYHCVYRYVYRSLYRYRLLPLLLPLLLSISMTIKNGI